MELLEGEEIKDVVGYEGLYAVTSFGRVWSYPKENNGNRNGKWLKQSEDSNKYLMVTLNKEKERKHKFIHRLVAETFISNPNNYPTVDHIDRNKLNNNVSNLRWATRSEQSFNRNFNSKEWKNKQRKNIKKAQKRAQELKTWTTMNENRKRKVYCVETNIIYESAEEAKRQTKIYHITECCKKERKTAGGYHWEFVEGDKNDS